MIALRSAFLAAVFAAVTFVPAPTAAAQPTADPDFFWLPPTVATAPTFTGPFDADALDSLSVEVCELADGACVDGPPIERMTSFTTPTPMRLTLDAANEFYSVEWLTGPSQVDRDRDYRVRVLLNDTEIGTIDVDFVQNTPELALVDSSRYIGLIRGQQLTLRFRVQRPTPLTRVRINEAESNQGIPGDWVELFNAAAVPIDLGGHIIKDNDDTHIYTFPAGTLIPANGYYVVEEDALGFGLGGNEAVRFYTPGATTLIDAVAWLAHAPTTYGRCPNGSGAFQVTTTVTKGAANDCRLLININEIESSGGSPGDWIELFNAGPAPANVSGFVVKDNDDTHVYVIPTGTTIVPGGYYVVEEAALGFGLGAADSVRLFDPANFPVDSFSWSAHAAVSYGRCPNGTGAFGNTFASTKGLENGCTAPVTSLHINEVESNGGLPGDWFELVNLGAGTIDLSGWRMLDNDDTHAPYVFPAGTVIGAGSYLVVEEAAFGFGLGGADSVRIFDADGALYEQFAWTAHAATTYGRCPNGTGAFVISTVSTKGAANNCVSPIKINEVESSGGTPGDWIELINPTAAAVDISGLIVRDNDDTHAYVIPAGTTVAANGFYVLEEAAFGFGLGSADSARIFDPTGALLDSFAWQAHAATTYGRCPNGAGAFVATAAATKGAVNTCPGDPLPWPGDPNVQTVDAAGAFPSNLSGLAYEGPGVLWAARNGPGSIYRLVFDGTIWTPDTTNNWSAGKLLRYPDGTGEPDAEGIGFADAGSNGGLYVATERNNQASSISRLSVLRFDAGAPGTELVATHEWNLTSDLPPVGANLGLEGITFVSDAFLLANGFFDERTNAVYNPATYPGHGAGLFFIGVEGTGTIYAYALIDDGTFFKIATIASGFPGVMELSFDADTGNLWAVCDDTCGGQSAVLQIDGSGRFAVAATVNRPSTMPNLNNEGFTLAPLTECNAGQRAVYWSDDSGTGGHAIRRGAISCTFVP